MLRKTANASATMSRAHAASMRPQRNAAENENMNTETETEREASMRPQRNAAENVLDKPA